MSERRYHVVVKPVADGPHQFEKVYMTGTPVTHAEGVTIMSKMTKYDWRMVQLEEVR